MGVLCSLPSGGSVAYDSAVEGAAHVLETSPDILVWSSALPIAFGLIMFGVVITALVYMISTIFNDEKMKAWVRLELFETFYSALILSLAVFAVGMADEVAQCISLNIPSATIFCASNTPIETSTTSVYSGIPYCHMKMAILYTDTLFKETNGFASLIYGDYMFKSMLSDLAINVEFVFEWAGFFTFNPWRGFFTVGNTLRNFLFETLVKLMLVTKFQEIFLVFIAKALFPVLFIFGAILRTFAFTRKLGGLLMAIALSLFFIYPMFYVFGMIILDKIKLEALSQCAALKDAGDPSDICDGDKISIFSNFYSNGKVPILGSFYEYKKEDYSTKGKKLSDVTSPFSDKTDGSVVSGQHGFNFGPTLCMDDNECLQKKEDCETIDDCKCSDERNDEGYGTCIYTEEKVEKLQESGSTWLGTLSNNSWTDTFFVKSFYKPGGYVDITARIAFFSMFFAFFGILASIAAIRNISMFLGGDIEIAGLTHLI